MRTTVAIDDPLLDELKAIQAQEGKTMGELLNELLILALAHRRSGEWKTPRFDWDSQPMGLRVNLEDKDALWALLDAESAG
jgi:hypothetical protein